MVGLDNYPVNTIVLYYPAESLDASPCICPRDTGALVYREHRRAYAPSSKSRTCSYSHPQTHNPTNREFFNPCRSRLQPRHKSSRAKRKPRTERSEGLRCHSFEQDVQETGLSLPIRLKWHRHSASAPFSKPRILPILASASPQTDQPRILVTRDSPMLASQTQRRPNLASHLPRPLAAHR